MEEASFDFRSTQWQKKILSITVGVTKNWWVGICFCIGVQ